jgi:osmotically inducible protein OsmC
MPIREASAVWEGNIRKGKGKMRLGSGAFEGPYSFASRFEDAPGTNPEELLGAAHAGCFSMALSLFLEQAGYISESIHTRAKVRIDKTDGGFRISTINLETEAAVPGIDEKTFLQKAEEAKMKCPVSQALSGTDIKLKARLVHEPSPIRT